MTYAWTMPKCRVQAVMIDALQVKLSFQMSQHTMPAKA